MTAMRTTSIEPTIAEVLSDPIVGLLMEHDGVTVEGFGGFLRIRGARSKKTEPPQ
jgi:hypothetical protein